MRTDDHLWIVILAGGVGSRFWPASTPERPKQLLPLASSRPLIRDTVERARSLVPDARLRILAGERLMEPFRRVLPDLPDESYMVEPEARGTCPVLAWAAHRIRAEDPDAIIVSLHADHLIDPLESFRSTVLAAAAIADTQRMLLTIGVVPDRIETGFGHIQRGAPISAPGGTRASRVKAFHEKPDEDTARRYMDEGYVWNSGIFVWRADVFLEEVTTTAPRVAACFPALDEGDATFFSAVPVCTVDEAVLERSARVGMVEATFRWDDVGSWEALARTRAGDREGNVAQGHVSVVDGTGNVVWAEEGHLVLFGVDDLVVVRSGDVTLVTRRDLAPRLKSLVARVEDV
ncbi:MAG: sugar phosphate nucleotidyltransferase [Gemmatimonadota bacterium]|nr:sugar phosphate nucleotidyltransferase [Gemmatimonadota bacterium]